MLMKNYDFLFSFCLNNFYYYKKRITWNKNKNKTKQNLSIKKKESKRSN